MAQPQDEQPLQTTLIRPSAYEVPPLAGAAPPFKGAAPPVGAAFTAGEAIGKTLRVWWKNLAPFTALSLIVTAPMAITFGEFQRRMLDLQRDPRAFDRNLFIQGAWILAAVGLVTAVLQVVALGAMTRGALGHLRGERVSFGAMLETGLRRGLPVVGAALVAWLAIALSMFLLVFPAIMLACAWAASIPAAVVERTGPLAALSRSAELTRGFRWKVFGTFAALFGIVWGFSTAVQLASGAFALLALSPAQQPIGTIVISQLGTALFSCIPSVGCAVTYHDLRAAREGLDTSQLASVFE